MKKRTCVKIGDKVMVLPREDFPSWMKEIHEIDPMYATIIDISGEEARVEPKSGDLPFWTDLARCKLTDF